MSLRLVRCPYCGKRFNITGITPGTRLRCAGCTAVLTVPRSEARPSSSPFSRFTLLQVGAGVAAGLAAAVGVWWLLRSTPATEPMAATPIPAVARPVPGPEALPESPGLTTLDDPLSRATTELYRDFNSSLILYTRVKPYLVALEPSNRFRGNDLVEAYAQRLETLHQAFRREFALALKLPAVDAVLPVVILESRESFDRYCELKDKRRMASAIKGIYEYNRRRIVTYHDINSPEEVLQHEGAHQLVHYYTLRETEGRKVPSTYWFQEGLGTYFEGFRRRLDGEIVMDPGIGHMRLPILKQTLLQQDRRDFIPLAMLVGMTVDEFWAWFELGSMNEPAEVTRKAQLYYAESWAFVHFLRQAGGNHRKIFDEYFRLELAGSGSKAAFEELVRNELGLDLLQLEDHFVKHIQGLR